MVDVGTPQQTARAPVCAQEQCASMPIHIRVLACVAEG